MLKHFTACRGRISRQGSWRVILDVSIGKVAGVSHIRFWKDAATHALTFMNFDLDKIEDKLLPVGEDDTTSYFSFFDVVEKVSIIVGTFSFGLIEYLTGGLRNSVLALAVFFIIGILLMTSLKVVAAKRTTVSK